MHQYTCWMQWLRFTPPYLTAPEGDQVSNTIAPVRTTTYFVIGLNIWYRTGLPTRSCPLLDVRSPKATFALGTGISFYLSVGVSQRHSYPIQGYFIVNQTYVDHGDRVV